MPKKNSYVSRNNNVVIVGLVNKVFLYFKYFSKLNFHHVYLKNSGASEKNYLYGHSSPRLHSPFTQNEQMWGLLRL